MSGILKRLYGEKNFQMGEDLLSGKVRVADPKI